MGVPGLYVRRYPFLAKPVSEAEGAEAPEVDELYIDWNQVVHNCTHANQALASQPEDKQMSEMCGYLDRLLALLRPRSLVMLAVDGVAPAAKIAQQRTRRYTSALRLVEAARFRDAAARELYATGLDDVSAAALAAATAPPFDSNIITPGTPFMERMEAALHGFLVDRLACGHPDWAGLELVWSPSTEPGEGEHKIMSFLRRRRAAPGYAPRAARAIVGQDADLLLLALATHEPRAMIVREQFRSAGAPPPPPPQPCGPGEEAVPGALSPALAHPLELVSIAALREALRWEFAALLGGEPRDADATGDGWSSDGGGDSSGGEPDGAAAGPRRASNGAAAMPANGAASGKRVHNGRRVFDLERVVDDLIVLSSLCGNDFLPHIPCLDLHDTPCGLETVWSAYKATLPKCGYISDRGEVSDPSSLAALLRALADGEGERLRVRAEKADRKARSTARRAAAQADAERGDAAGGGADANADWDLEEVRIGAAHRTIRGAPAVSPRGDSLDCGADECGGGKDVAGPGDGGAAVVAELRRLVDERMDALFAPVGGDKLRLGSPGDADRYYEAHCPAGMDVTAAPAAMAAAFCEGVGWVAAYYLRGAGAEGGAPWRWAYPYDAAPLMRHVAAAAQRSRSLLPDADAAAKAAAKAARATPPKLSKAERKAHKARRAAQLRAEKSGDKGCGGEDEADDDEEEEEAAAAWARLPDGPVPTELQLLAVIPPESAAACFPPPCARLLAAATASSDDARGAAVGGLVSRLSSSFPPAHVTAGSVTRGCRFAWQAAVRVPPARFALLSAALSQLGWDGGQQRPPSSTVLLVNHVRHPEAAFAIAGCAPTSAAAGGAATLIHAAQWSADQAGGAAAPHDDVLCVPIDLCGPAPPFGGGRLPGATEPPRVVTKAVWRAARTGGGGFSHAAGRPQRHGGDAKGAAVATAMQPRPPQAQPHRGARAVASSTLPPAAPRAPAVHRQVWPADWERVPVSLPPSLLPATAHAAPPWDEEWEHLPGDGEQASDEDFDSGEWEEAPLSHAVDGSASHPAAALDDEDRELAELLAAAYG